jgi:hypothetical protein
MKATVTALALAALLFVTLPAAPASAMTCIGAYACSNGSYTTQHSSAQYIPQQQHYAQPKQGYQYQYYQPYYPSASYQTYSYSYPQYTYYQPAYYNYSYSSSWQSSSWYGSGYSYYGDWY